MVAILSQGVQFPRDGLRHAGAGGMTKGWVAGRSRQSLLAQGSHFIKTGKLPSVTGLLSASAPNEGLPNYSRVSKCARSSALIKCPDT